MKSELTNHNPAEAEALDSREVAEMVGKRHDHLMRDIKGYVAEMEKANVPNYGGVNERKITSADFFIPSTYVDGKGELRPRFLITKKGCEFVANKLTGSKGIQFTAAYVTRFNQMEIREQAVLKGNPVVQTPKLPPLSSVNNAVKLTLQTMEEVGVDPAFKLLALRDIYAPYGLNIPTNGLPDGEKTYDLTTMAEILGVLSARSGKHHKNAIGAVIQMVGVMEQEVKRVPYTNNGHSGFTDQYTESVLERVRWWLKTNGWPTEIKAPDGTSYKVIYRKGEQ